MAARAVTTASLNGRRYARGALCIAILFSLTFLNIQRRYGHEETSNTLLGMVQGTSPSLARRASKVPRQSAASPEKVGTLYPEFARREAKKYSPESSLGPVEYKLKLNAEKGSQRFEELVSQLNWRMRECDPNMEDCEVDVGRYGEAIYRVGVMDDGEVVGLEAEEMQRSLETLQAMADCIPAVVTIVSETAGLPPGNKTSVTALVRSKALELGRQGGWKEVRICTIGNVDSGKSTLLGALTMGLQDDGRGKARSPIFRHQHEMESGRTSSVSRHLLGFDASGQVVNYCEDSSGTFRVELPEQLVAVPEAQARVVERASKLIIFSDLCGHEKYFKTTLVGLLGFDADYLLCTVDSNRGTMRGMVREHLMVAKALAIPTVVCLTKCDIAEESSIAACLSDVKGFLKEAGSPALLIRSREDVARAAERVRQGWTPIFLCSAVSGEMIPELKLLLNLLPRRRSLTVSRSDSNDAQVVIEDFYPNVAGVGIVVLGRVVTGTVREGDLLRLGPVAPKYSAIGKNGFVQVRVSSIMFEGARTPCLNDGSTGTFAIKVQKAAPADVLGVLRHARMMLGAKSRLGAHSWLRVDVTILQHPSSIRVGYEPVLHAGVIHQAAKIFSMQELGGGAELQTLRAGDQASILFKWKARPEVVEVGETIVFREGLMKGMGTVTWVGDIKEKAPDKKGARKDMQRAKVTATLKGSRPDRKRKHKERRKGRHGRR